MATLRQCDRCKVQWNTGTEADRYTAQITFGIPGKKDSPPAYGNKAWTPNPGIDESGDYCQGCARAIHTFATTKPEDIIDTSP